MSLYDAAKDALKVAQKADNIELIQKLLDVQQMALDMQDKQQQLNAQVVELKNEINHLKSVKKFVLVEHHSYMVDPDSPNRPLCPICTPKLSIATPLSSASLHCYQCKGYYR